MISTYTKANVTAFKQPKISQYRPFWADSDAFWDAFRSHGKWSLDGVRARSPFVAILSVRSDPLRSKRVMEALARSQLSAASSEDLKLIYRELARSGHHLAPWRADQGAAERFRRSLWLRKRAPSACTPRVLRQTLWSPWKRSESTPWSVPAINSHFGRGPNHSRRAIEWRWGSPR